MEMYAEFNDLKGASVFVTGGASGIGAAVVEGFVAQGSKVTAIDLLDGSDFAQRLGARYGAPPTLVQGDITKTDVLVGAMQAAAAANGPLDVLVNVAANDLRHKAEDTTPDFWDWMMDINLKVYFFACQEAGRQMAERGGAIVNYSSISYLMGLGGYASYTAANAGITAMSQSLARDWGPKNIRVNAIAPGWVLTPRQKEKWVTAESLAAHMARQCLKIEMLPEHVVEPTLFLASKASRLMTGQCMAVDAGVVVSG